MWHLITEWTPTVIAAPGFPLPHCQASASTRKQHWNSLAQSLSSCVVCLYPLIWVHHCCPMNKKCWGFQAGLEPLALPHPGCLPGWSEVPAELFPFTSSLQSPACPSLPSGFSSTFMTEILSTVKLKKFLGGKFWGKLAATEVVMQK